MIEILKILKDGSIKIINIDEINELNLLYKKCNFRKDENFINIYTIKYKNYKYEIWGKDKGKDNQKNIYNFNNIFSTTVYGNCLILLKENENYINFNLIVWQKIIKLNSSFDNENDENNENINNNNKNEKSNNNEENDSSDNEDIDISTIELNKEEYIYTSDEEI
tara:strand:- start:96 stop:590 length:495 start_codon:yes stop_codon:yes gene_type:complete